jgi:signal transduction histidine kinase
MSAFNILSSEATLWENEQATFINDVHVMITTLENQQVLSNEWIARMERSGQFIISISDNGNPILYERLAYTPQRQQVVHEARGKAFLEYGFFSSGIVLVTRVTNFTLNAAGGGQYYVSAVLIPRETGVLEVLIIYPLAPLNQQIFNQRMIFLVLNLLGIGLLGLFSYFFTKKMLEPLRKSRKQQTEFIASASHELRTPLAVIQSSLSALEKANEEEAVGFYASIESECERMSRLVSDLLALASTDSYVLSTQMKEVELDTLILDVVEKFDLISQEKEIRLYVDLPPDKIPTIKGDEIRLTQVFAILIDNAISYGNIGSDVAIEVEVLKSRVQIQVVDNGIGIPDDEKEKIWERFYRVDSSRKSGKHFGLGLPIAKEIINLHKGRIAVKDNPSGGSIFTVTLVY